MSAKRPIVYEASGSDAGMAGRPTRRPYVWKLGSDGAVIKTY
jgi:hypothetical protein